MIHQVCCSFARYDFDSSAYDSSDRLNFAICCFSGLYCFSVFLNYLSQHLNVRFIQEENLDKLENTVKPKPPQCIEQRTFFIKKISLIVVFWTKSCSLNQTYNKFVHLYFFLIKFLEKSNCRQYLLISQRFHDEKRRNTFSFCNVGRYYNGYHF